jgi:hypothetical protein
MEHDEARASLHQETVQKLRGIVRSALGVSADELFSIGYRSLLNN